MLFDKFQAEKSREAPEWRADDKARQVTRKERILATLIKAGDWVSTASLVAIDHRFSTCVNDLRDEGHIIDKRRTAAGFEYKYAGLIQALPTSGGWQERYYESAHWKQTRHNRMQHDGWRCAICHSTELLQVHHWRYDLFAENVLDLLTLCDGCHERVHQYPGVRICFPSHVTRAMYEKLVAP